IRGVKGTRAAAPRSALVQTGSLHTVAGRTTQRWQNDGTIRIPQIANLRLLSDRPNDSASAQRVGADWQSARGGRPNDSPVAD
ncbi:MAG: hypothetical protein ACKOSQ_01670, partial [Planctomycetaceae bacterium]